MFQIKTKLEGEKRATEKELFFNQVTLCILKYSVLKSFYGLNLLLRV